MDIWRSELFGDFDLGRLGSLPFGKEGVSNHIGKAMFPLSGYLLVVLVGKAVRCFRDVCWHDHRSCSQGAGISLDRRCSHQSTRAGWESNLVRSLTTRLSRSGGSEETAGSPLPRPNVEQVSQPQAGPNGRASLIANAILYPSRDPPR
jgi:hypothetical protein